MSIQTGRTPKVDVGTPRATSKYQLWDAIEVHFNEFENLPSAVGNYVDSPEFACFGHRWLLRLYPGGKMAWDDGNVSIYLRNQSDEGISIQYGIGVKTNTGKGMFDCSSSGETLDFAQSQSGVGCSWRGRCKVALRSEVIKNLVQGSLIVEVRMRQPQAVNSPPLPFVAENPISKNILARFMDEKSADVVLEVSSEVAAGSPKRTKISALFHAHRFIVRDWRGTIGDLCKQEGDMTPIPITDVKPEIFRHVLFYAYGGKVADADLKAYARDIINATDKYGVVGLKLEAEACLVATTPITIDNAIDNLLYADAKNCALLKEAVIDFLVENGDEAVKKLSFDDVPGSVVKDLLTAMNRGKKEGNDSSNGSDFSTMRVSTLRKMLHEKGLDIDGSRETMIARLEEHSSD